MFVSFPVGLLTRHRTELIAFSLERIEQWHFQEKEVNLTIALTQIASGSQRLVRPGITPEFPVPQILE